MPVTSPPIMVTDLYTTVPVRNLMPKSNVSYTTGDVSIEWGYAGSPDGSDLQEVPLHLWNTAHFRKARAKGILAEDTQEAMDAAFTAQRQADAAKAAERRGEVEEALHSGMGTVPIVISEEAFTEHVEKVSKTRGQSEVLVQAEEAQRQAQMAQDSQLQEAVSDPQPVQQTEVPEAQAPANPMSVISQIGE